jgi:NADH dehydrogenase FAD-containing subunit
MTRRAALTKVSSMNGQIVIAGGGIAALEASLALRSTAGSEVQITLVCPEQEFEYRPLSVLQAFGGPHLRVDLEAFAAEHDITLVRDAVAAVDAEQRTLTLSSGEDVGYEDLLLATGGVPRPALRGAEVFSGAADVARLDAMLAEVELGEASTVAFVATGAQDWVLPLYELALLARHRLTASGRRSAEVLVVTAEDQPIEALGADASEAASLLLAAHGVGVIAGVEAREVRDRGLHLDDGKVIPADHVITLPLYGVPDIGGLPGGGGLVPIDDCARVVGAAHLYAAGDVTLGYPKQGGLAARQAAAAASAMLAARGLVDAATPFTTDLAGVLFTPLVLEHAAVGDPWQPATKIVAEHLAAYLETRDPDSRDPATWSTSRGAIPTEIEVGATAAEQ